MRPRSSARTWVRRVLLTIAVTIGAWTLLGVSSGVAAAKPHGDEPCTAVGDAQPLGTPAAAHVPGSMSSDDELLSPTETCAVSLATPRTPAADPPVPSPPDAIVPAEPEIADPADPPAPEPADAPESTAPPESTPAPEQETDAAPPVPRDDPAPEAPLDRTDDDAAGTTEGTAPKTSDGAGSTVDAPSTDPVAVDDPAPADPALVDPPTGPEAAPVDAPSADPTAADPAVLDPAAVDAAALDPAAVDAAALDPAAVDPAAESPVPAAVVAPTAPCSGSDAGVAATTDVGAPLVGDDVSDRPQGIRGGSPAPALWPAEGSAPAEVADPDGAPAAPTTPPAPVSLPIPRPTTTPPSPAGPVGAPGSSTAASSGTSVHGPGETDDADRMDAVLVARITASLAQAAERPTSGFAGSVVGNHDDPGVRPG